MISFPQDYIFYNFGKLEITIFTITFICILLRIDLLRGIYDKFLQVVALTIITTLSLLSQSIITLSLLSQQIKFVRARLPVKLQGANCSLANEVVRPPPPKDFTGNVKFYSQKEGPWASITIVRYTRYTKSIFCIQSWKVLARVSHQRCRSRNRTPLDRTYPVAKITIAPQCVADHLQSSRFCARKLRDTPLLFWQQHWQLVLACKCVFAGRKIENLVGRPRFFTL